jgi:hypothetical protein
MEGSGRDQIEILHMHFMSRDSEQLRAERPRGRSSRTGRVKDFLFSTAFRLALGPPNLLPNAYWGLFPRGGKRPGREADHSTPASVEVKEMWIYTATPPYVFMA